MSKQIALNFFILFSLLAIPTTPSFAQESKATTKFKHGTVGELPADLQQLGQRFKLTFKDRRANTPVKGIWRSRGYGFLVDLTGDEPNIYVGTETLCWPTDLGKGNDSLDSPDLNAFYLDGKSKVTFTGEPGGTYYAFDRLAKLPSPCTNQLSVTPEVIFDAFWQAMNERYAFFQLRGIDWFARREQYRPEALAAKNDEQLYQVLTDAMTGFGDSHLTLTADVAGEKKRFRELKPSEHLLLDSLAAQKNAHSINDVWDQWVKSDQDRIARELMNGQVHHALDGHMMWGTTKDNIGYIYINLMEDYGGGTTEKDAVLVAMELDKVLQVLSNADAMIVDVTQNRGGDDRIARVIASRFTDKKRLAYTKRVRFGKPQPIYLYPAGPRQFLKPVYIVTSELTHSAAEVFALAMRVLPNVVQVGQSTGGALSDMLETPLPNHWLLTFSNEIYLDPAKHLYESNGIPAQKDIEVFQPNDLASGHVAAVRKVLELAHKKQIY